MFPSEECTPKRCIGQLGKCNQEDLAFLGVHVPLCYTKSREDRCRRMQDPKGCPSRKEPFGSIVSNRSRRPSHDRRNDPYADQKVKQSHADHYWNRDTGVCPLVRLRCLRIRLAWSIEHGHILEHLARLAVEARVSAACQSGNARRETSRPVILLPGQNGAPPASRDGRRRRRRVHRAEPRNLYLDPHARREFWVPLRV
jgi:hypothetical protein